MTGMGKRIYKRVRKAKEFTNKNIRSELSKWSANYLPPSELDWGEINKLKVLKCQYCEYFDFTMSVCVRGWLSIECRKEEDNGMECGEGAQVGLAVEDGD